jgi:hypothetical protein
MDPDIVSDIERIKAAERPHLNKEDWCRKNLGRTCNDSDGAWLKLLGRLRQPVN